MHGSIVNTTMASVGDLAHVFELLAHAFDQGSFPQQQFVSSGINLLCMRLFSFVIS
jgi:hypothetical protein